MEDLIAHLYPFDEIGDGYATRTIESNENRSRFVAATESLPDLPFRNYTESTTSLDGNEEITPESFRILMGLQLKFSHGPKAGPGFVLGTDRNSCDIVLPSLSRISRRHCYLSFDAQRRLIVRDRSRHGTTVTYGGLGEQKRRNFTWIIGGHSVLDRTGKIVIQLDKNLKFQIVVSKPSRLDLYLENVDNFLQKAAASTSPAFGAVDTQSNAPKLVSSAVHTLDQDPIFLTRETIGSGAFSEVNRAWDVSTGLEYASKRFHNLRISDWRNEAYIMGQMSHSNLVRLHFVIERPSPKLILEYVPLGNLYQSGYWHRPSKEEMIKTLVQSLSALTYLHGQTPPIVHRDIKPENILIQSLDPFHIKLGDFGLSKASEDLKTFCGTYTYLAPEVSIYYGSKAPSDLKYTRAVDIWSLGVVILQYVYGLPHLGSGAGPRWCQDIVKRLNDCESDGLVDLLSNMVAMEPERRYSAEKCLRMALKLHSPGKSPTPTPNERPKSRSEQQRPPEKIFGESYRRAESVSPLHPVSTESVLWILSYIRSGRGDYKAPDSRTSALIDVLCQHFKRLKITHLKRHTKYAAERVFVAAIDQAHEFALANFASPNLENSIADLAEYLIKVLQQMDQGTTNSSNLSVNQLCSQDSQRAEGTRCIEAAKARSVEGGTGTPTQAAKNPCDDENLNKANENDHGWPTNSMHSWSTTTDNAHPVTYPSALLDETNISGCSLPAPR